MAKLLNWYRFAQTLREKRLALFSVHDIRRLFGTSLVAATFLLHRYLQKGFIVRLRRGLYALPDTLPPDPLIANKMVEPSYVSLVFALSYHGVIPETVYEITSVTTKSTRRFEALGKMFSYRSVKPRVFTGYRMERQGEGGFLIADPEKALVDTDYFRIIDRLEPLSRLDKKNIDAEKALHYARLFGNPKLIERIRRMLL